MNLDYAVLSDIAEDFLELQIGKQFNDFDSMMLRQLIRFIKDLYGKRPPETLDGDLVVIGSDVVPDCLKDLPAMTHRSGTLQALVRTPAVIQALGDGAFRLWNGQACTSEDLSMKGLLAYELSTTEWFWANGAKFPVRNLAGHSRSAFSVPTFLSLEDALRSYYDDKVRRTPNCELKAAWRTLECLRWRPGPEHLLRDSLYEYLNPLLRGVSEVKREQNVDEDNPVDIKVSFKFSNARALIEIKWLGKSYADNGRETNDHSNSRANHGATQLRGYLDTSESENREFHFFGYLVVYDGRRRGLADYQSPVSPQEAWFYKDKEIEYSPENLADRRLRLNHRLYVEPRLA